MSEPDNSAEPRKAGLPIAKLAPAAVAALIPGSILTLAGGAIFGLAGGRKYGKSLQTPALGMTIWPSTL